MNGQQKDHFSYDEKIRTRSGDNSKKSLPIILILLGMGLVAYVLNFEGFRDTIPQSSTKPIPTTAPTVCPTLYNGPQSIIEDGRLKLITPTPHPCQLGTGQNEAISPTQEPTATPSPTQ